MPDTTNINNILHSSLIVSDLKKALTFYEEVLGFQQVLRPDLGYDGAWLKAGGQQIHLLQLDNPDPVTGRPEHVGRDRHTAFSIKSIEKLAQQLEQAAVKYTRSQSGRKAIFCRDPDGNGLEFIQTDQGPGKTNSP